MNLKFKTKIYLNRTYFILLFSIITSMSSCGDKDQLKNQIKKEVLSEIGNNNSHLIKGDGSNFYGEPISIGRDDYYIHHSTLNCPLIQVGVQRNWYKISESNNIFCHLCMNDDLITRFHKRFFSK